jgi:riboflavin synthase
MFTGIVEETGVVRRVAAGASSIELSVEASVTSRGTRPGDSVAVNGCCLTVTSVAGRGRRRTLHFDLLRETWQRTNLRGCRAGGLVNLERALAMGARLGGHFVTGHIDGVGVIRRWERSGRDRVLEVEAPAAILGLVVFKGSIAVDGISLTVAAAGRRRFRLWIIPHTYAATALRQRRVGDEVNLETDLLGKYVAKLFRGLPSATGTRGDVTPA